MKTIDSTFESTLYPRLIHKTFIKNFKFMTYARVNRGGGIFEYSPRKWAKSHTQKLFLIIFE